MTHQELLIKAQTLNINIDMYRNTIEILTLNPESTINYTTYDLTHKEYTGPRYICGVPDWILSENFDEADNRAVRSFAYDAKIKRETEKAVLIQFITDFGSLFTWCPKSVFKGTAFNN